ncbi:MAG TPA: zinc-binding dehydrogenase [Candidatus Binatia bacterium]|nr:zinc-binding dehydrogenase [Candidatus Binatia bacterium]
MKAVRFHAHGGAEKLNYEEAPEPKILLPTDAIIRLKAAAINRIDLSIRGGLGSMEVTLPHIPGSDGAGIVSEVGAHVNHIKAGDAVCLYPAISCRQCEFCVTDREILCQELRVLGAREHGTYAEYVRLPALNCFPVPVGLSFEEAAGFPLSYVTAWRMLVTNARLKPGEQVLILGVGGGVASAALQIAACLGSHIIVTSSNDEKLALAGNLGAEHGINYRNTDFSRKVRDLTGKRGVDVVLDCVGGDNWPRSLASLAKGGRLVTCGAIAGANPRTDMRRIFWNHLRIFGSTLGSRKEFRQLLNFLEASQTKPIIDRVFPLREAYAAQQRLEEGKQFGKVILSIDG